jgi:hypothetical protein
MSKPLNQLSRAASRVSLSSVCISHSDYQQILIGADKSFVNCQRRVPPCSLARRANNVDTAGDTGRWVFFCNQMWCNQMFTKVMARSQIPLAFSVVSLGEWREEDAPPWRSPSSSRQEHAVQGRNESKDLDTMQ